MGTQLGLYMIIRFTFYGNEGGGGVANRSVLSAAIFSELKLLYTSRGVCESARVRSRVSLDKRKRTNSETKFNERFCGSE